MALKARRKKLSKEHVEYIEPASIAVGRFILDSGYILGGSFGWPLSSLKERTSFLILKEGNRAKKKRFFVFNYSPRYIILGRVIVSPKQGQEEDFGLCMVSVEIFGRSNLSCVKILAEKIANRFDVRVRLRLVQEELRIGPRAKKNDCASLFVGSVPCGLCGSEDSRELLEHIGTRTRDGDYVGLPHGNYCVACVKHVIDKQKRHTSFTDVGIWILMLILLVTSFINFLRIMK
ncbi:MAG: hypothetical protein A3A04_00755 [Candidatus Harrisonbacteria bacterium RIFCSPLOWO2_01_FULL_40_28]|uniref:Uncharacterized protein n=2 Tax=Candidatus Harrisoniibacteriota TaxID=1817905 RepID=A0A1G1ZYV2_9BACT|nr:MAG: hypothetical protein A3A04_00755 [Candidatus Harrisonbacteria bacterium RIFCSPLOWO2_01_FULL_40_28]OGY69783.1 MAG: hypothetical protein A2586_00555 [Candidatus Harrisonbacteria bacterium RIFOXYD1_FULL_40_9]